MNLIQYWKEKTSKILMRLLKPTRQYAANQFLAEPDLVKKYQLDEFLEEHNDD